MAGNPLMGGVDTSSYDSSDVNRLLATPSNSPQQFGANVGVAQGIQQLSQSQFDLASKRLNALNTIASSVLADPSNDNLVSRISDGVRAGVLSSDVAAQALSTTANMTPQQRQQWAFQHSQMLATHAQQLQAAGMAPPNLVSDGNRLNPVVIRSGPNAGIAAGQGGSIPLQLSPDKRTEPRTYTTATGKEKTTDVGTLYDDAGNFRGIPVMRGGAAGTPTASQGAAPVQPPAAVSAPQAGADSDGPGLTTRLAPSTTADQAASTQAFTTLRDDTGPSRMRATNLGYALDALRGTNTGLGTQARQNLLNAINALPGGVGKTLVPDSDKLSNFDLTKKYLSAVASQAASAGRSDQALGAAFASNPNVEMTQPAAIEVTQNMIGAEKMRQAQAVDFQQQINSGAKTPADFSAHATTEFSKASDPKAYALGAMTPPERAAYFGSLKGQAKTTFLNGVRMGLKTGVLTSADLQGASGNGGQ